MRALTTASKGSLGIVRSAADRYLSAVAMSAADGTRGDVVSGAAEVALTAAGSSTAAAVADAGGVEEELLAVFLVAVFFGGILLKY